MAAAALALAVSGCADESAKLSAEELKLMWSEANGACRGDPPYDPDLNPACHRRTEIGEQLAELDWCYSSGNEASYLSTWRSCSEEADNAAVPQPQSPQSSPLVTNQPPAFLDRSVTMGEWKYYVILASAPQGSGNAAARAAQLNHCLRYQPATDSTYAFEGLASELEFVHLGGYSTVGEANRVAAWARNCEPDVYVKRAKFLFD